MREAFEIPWYYFMLVILKRAVLESQEHLGNSLRCLYSINLSHVSIAGSCVIISSHVLSWRGPFAEQKAGVEHLLVTGAEHRHSASHKACSLVRKRRLKMSELQSARLKRGLAGGKPMAGRYDN